MLQPLINRGTVDAKLKIAYHRHVNFFSKNRLARVTWKDIRHPADAKWIVQRRRGIIISTGHADNFGVERQDLPYRSKYILSQCIDRINLLCASQRRVV